MRLTDLKIIVKTSNITLYDKDDETELWNEETYKKIVSESQVSEVTETETEKSKDKTPKTGNTSTIIVIALGILSIISSAGAILIKE